MVVSTTKPAPIQFPGDLMVVMQIDCGTFHTAALLHTGEVYTFGNGNHGQLGQGNTKICGHPVKVELPCGATQVACGDNHTVVLLQSGEVYTFGKHQEGQLGRRRKEGANAETWHTVPARVDSIGGGGGGACKVTWIGAKGNQTFFAVDEMLVSKESLSRCKVFSSSSPKTTGIVPPVDADRKTSFIMINSDLKPKKFDDEEQQELSGCGVYLDPEYNVLWSYSAEENRMCCFNPITANIEGDSTGTILSTSICLPTSKEAHTSRSHIAMNLLSCLSSLATQDRKSVV